MAFNWKLFLEQHNIPYITKGPNVRSGNININCPWCRDDPSHHLGIFPDGGVSCWRDSNHSGTHTTLVAKLLGCSLSQASQLVNPKRNRLTEFEFISNSIDDLFSDKDYATDESTETGKLTLRNSFKKISWYGSSKIHFNYLKNRRKSLAYDKDEVNKIIDKYSLMYSLDYDWSSRVIYPVYRNQQLITWTGRSIQTNPAIRYKSLSHRENDYGGEVAVDNIKHTIGNYDSVMSTGGDKLFIVEGPFDFINFDLYSENLNCRAVCLYSTSIKPEQVRLLHSLKSRFNRFCVLLDGGQLENSITIMQELALLEPKLLIMEGDSDPGELTPEQVYGYCREDYYE